ncbi:MAG: dipeptidase [Candidatus Latescibacteria bacterium]|nr:dipeptidase [Candidatus Latescibacterota bacterium]
MIDRVLVSIDTHRDASLEGLKAFLRIPSVSTHPPHKPDVLRCAEFVAAEMRRIGLRQVEVTPTTGHPIVYGEWLDAPGKPTVLMYGHYDVQPPEPLDLWDSGPFDPTVRGDNLYARGATDDKGQVWLHLKALDAHLTQTGRLPVNVKLLIEGEEEIGSPHLDAYVRANQDRLRADVVLISDTTMFDYDQPSICYGLRGLVYMEIEVQGPSKDLHSGGFGGSVANPVQALAEILTALKDPDGRITIPGFYDDVQPLTPEERAALAALPFDEDAYRTRLGVSALAGETGYSTLERIWARPTLEVNGILGGFTGEGSKTIIPSRGMAKVSMRLVPDQTPDRIAALFEEHVTRLAPPTVTVTVKRHSSGKPVLTPTDQSAVQAAAHALERGFGKKPVFIREGGSIPVVATFREVLGLPTVLMGFGLPDCDAHAPNEKFNLKNFYRGMVSAAWFYEELGKSSDK